MAMRRSCIVVVAGLTACGGAGAPKAATDWLATDYHLAPGLKPVVHEGAVYSCVRLMLRPEDGGASKGTWEVMARIQHPMKLPSSYRSAKQAEAACAAAGGTFVRLDKLQSFINGAASESPANTSASCTEAEKEPAAEAREAPSSSELARAVAQWNDRFFNMDTAVTRQNADRFHGRGTEHKHLAQEVTHLVMPKAVQQRILERLATHREALFGDGGAGQGGTTGAYFLAGNVGFGNANQGANLMDLVFPPDPSAKKASSGGALNGDGDAYAIKKGGKLFGEIDDGSGGAPAVRPPDLLAYEEEVRRLLMQRSDVDYLFGDEVEIEWQHRLWRYGPNFDPKAKGGIWHKDTCPFGINGALPENSVMFTIVYILYTENLDGPTAGTRVKDDDGTSISLPCVAGEGNVIRSGESDSDAFFHSGPLNIRKLDQSRPAYRVMLQSKALVRPADGRKRAIPSKGNWRGLGIAPLVFAADAKPAEQVSALGSWLQAASARLTKGVGESNAVGFEAYPVNVGRAWAVTADLCAFLGVHTLGLLPEPDSPATPVVVFGWDQRYTEEVVDALKGSSFRVLNVASDSDFAALREAKQETYSNLQTADIAATDKVSAMLQSYPYDLHVVLDVPPVGERSIGESVLQRYGSALALIAAKGHGEGRLCTITLLSQQMPTSGRDSAGKKGQPLSPKGQPKGQPLSKVQKAFLALEKELVDFGETHGVRVVIMRVADRVYAPSDSALSRRASAPGKRPNPCRVETCAEAEPITRVHSEDLGLVLKRMLSMFDIVETHGMDSSLRGTASMASSISRFPSGTVLEVVDDAPAWSMLKADLLASVIMGQEDICQSSCANVTGSMPEAMVAHRTASGRNAELKAALGMPQLRYPTMHHGASKMFAAGEL